MPNHIDIRFKKRDDGKGYDFKYEDPSSVPSFIKLVFRTVSSNGIVWTQDQSITDSHPLRIIVHTPDNLLLRDPKNIISFGQDEPNIKKPILHLVVTSVFNDNLYGDLPLPFRLPRYYQYMDNSIWNYYVPMIVYEKNDSFQGLFNEAIEKIYDNYENKIYEFPVAEEYANLNARILQQSYLSGSHAKGVSPFIFHSETAIERLIDKDKGCKRLRKGYGKETKRNEDSAETYKCDWRWRFLLVDDKAVEKDANNVPNINCKMSIVKRLIERALFNDREDKNDCVQYREYKNGQFGKKNINGEIVQIDKETLSKAIILIDCVSSLDDAVKVLKSYKYDIVLLDYLLDGVHSRNYGYELLEEIDKVEILFEQFNDFRLEIINKGRTISEQLKSSRYKDDYQNLIAFVEDRKNHLKEEKDINKIEAKLNDERFMIGPRERMFFIFISAYTTAVNERLLAQGLNRSENYWYIDTGACPTNTPKLFTYRLLQLMDKRLDDSGILNLSVNEILKLIKEIFMPREMVADNSSVRERASKYYQDVLSLQYYYRKMLKDVEIPQGYQQGDHLFNIKESVLISHFMLENQHLDGLLEHLTELVHLTAFGTIRQWAEMWEEYLYIRAKFEEIDDGQQDFKAVCDYIEEYILNLKAQQR